MNKIVYLALLVLLAVVSFLSFSSSLYLVLSYHVQQPVFFATNDFFSRAFSQPGGFVEYLSLLLTQFFQFQTWGAVIIAVFSVLYFVNLNLLLKSGSNKIITSIISLFPVVIFSFLLVDTHFPFIPVVALFFVLAALLLIKSIIKSSVFSFISLALLPFTVYYLCGSGAFWIFSISAVLLIFYLLPVKAALLRCLFLILFAVPVPWLSFHYIFNVNDHVAFLSFMPDVPVHLRYSQEWPFELFTFSIPAVLIFMFVLKLLKIIIPDKTLVKVFVPLSSLIVLGTGFLLFQKDKNEKELSFAKASYYNSKEEWNKLEEEIMNSNEYDYRLNYFFNRSIDHQGKFIEKFFNYPQYAGGDILFPDKMNSGSLAMMSSDYYLDLGYVNESMHWAYEAQSIEPNNKRTLERLVETNYIAGNMDGAAAFLRLLENQFFTSDFVQKYKLLLSDTSLAKQDPFIELKRKQMPLESIISDDISTKFRLLLQKDSTNKRAYEHLQMYYLLNHQAGDFMNMYQKYPGLNPEKLPDVYAQAVIIFLMQTKRDEFYKYPISDASKKRIMNYMKTLKSFHGNKEAARAALIPEHSNSYMFYLNYDSPIITKGALKSREVQEYQN